MASAVGAVAAMLALLGLPGVAFADDGEVTTTAPPTEVQGTPEDPPADLPPPTEPEEPEDPVVTIDPAEPAPADGAGGEPGAPAPQSPTSEGAATSPGTGYGAPPVDPPDRAVAANAAAVEPTGYGSPAGVKRDDPKLNRVHVDDGGASGSAKEKAQASCRRTDVGEVGDNSEVHGPGGTVAGCAGPSAISINTLNEPVTVGDVTFVFTIEDTPQGELLHFTTDVPFTGSLFVKGGPNHFQCDFDAVTEGTCHAPVNTGPPHDPFHDFSHVDVCVGESPPPPPPDGGDGPGGGGPGGGGPGGGGPGGGTQQEGGGGQQQDEQEQREEDAAKEAPPGVTPAGVPTAAAAVPGEALPFTGFDPAWLVLFGAVLLVGGALVRRLAN